jgi:hypothetical protein
VIHSQGVPPDIGMKHPRGVPPDRDVTQSRYRAIALSRFPDDGQVGDMKNSGMSPSDTFHRFVAEK